MILFFSYYINKKILILYGLLKPDLIKHSYFFEDWSV